MALVEIESGTANSLDTVWRNGKEEPIVTCNYRTVFFCSLFVMSSLLVLMMMGIGIGVSSTGDSGLMVVMIGMMVVFLAILGFFAMYIVNYSITFYESGLVYRNLFRKPYHYKYEDIDFA